MNFTDETNIITEDVFTTSASSVSPTKPIDEDTGWSSGGKSLEDQISIRIIYGGIAILGIVGNFLVIFTVARVPNLRTLTNVFIVSLASCDFITSVFLIPLHLGFNIPIPQGAAGSVMCSMLLSKWPLWTSFTASVLSLACVTLERYFNICHPLHYGAIFTNMKAGLLVVAVWVAAIIMNSYMFYVFSFDGEQCVLDWLNVVFQKFLGISNFFVIYAIPLTTMGICYVLIMMNLSKSAKSLSRNIGKENEASLELLRARKKVIKMLAIVVITFAICWAPNQFLFLSYNLGYNLNFGSPVYHFSVLIAFCNSCMNPLIYGFKSKSYRKALKLALCGRRAGSTVSDMDTVAALA
ncbi:allatostatin-A receptor-like [Amphiura filiformis]|uniref:allatostatin-A receptor-like n=1 Tax=Amphiura filiformis TaxID=82378 RepID=UPI003B226A92